MLHREARIRTAVVYALVCICGGLLTTNAFAADQAAPGTLASARTLTLGTPQNPKPNPSIKLTKSASACSPASNGDGFSATFSFLLQNTGETDLHNVSLEDNLTATFGAVPYRVLDVSSPQLEINPSFDGREHLELLAENNVLYQSGNSAIVRLEVEINAPRTNPTYQFVNKARATAQSESISAHKTKQSFGSKQQKTPPIINKTPVPNDHSSTKLTCNYLRPTISVEKSASEPVLDSSGSFYTSTFTIEVSNPGTVPLQSLSLTDDLNIAFSNPEIAVSVSSSPRSNDARFTPNQRFGLSDVELLEPGQSLHPGERFQISFDVSLSPTDVEDRGPFLNTVTASGQAEGQTVRDQAVATIKLPKRTTETRVGLAKDGQCAALENGGYEITYRFVLTNYGTAALQNLNVRDELTARFDGLSINNLELSQLASGIQLPINPDFDGIADHQLLLGGASLPAGATSELILRLQLGAAAAGRTFTNTAKALADQSIDFSVAGINPDPNGDRNPTERSETIVECTPPAIQVVKNVSTLRPESYPQYAELVDLSSFDGHLFETTVEVTNSGLTVLTDVGLLDDLDVTFPSDVEYQIVVPPAFSYPLVANESYGTGGDWQLLADGISLDPGGRQQVSFVVGLTPLEIPNRGPFTNTVYAVGTAPDGERVRDEDSDIFEVIHEQPPGLSLTKEAEITDLPRGIVRFTLNLSNTGQTALHNVQITDDLTETFPPPIIVSSEGTPTVEGNLTLNPTYFAEMPRELNLLTGTDTLQAGEEATITFSVRLSPDEAFRPGEYINEATATADPPNGGRLTTTADDDVAFPAPPLCELDLNVTTNKQTVRIGENIRYTLTVTNRSRQPVPFLEISDSPPPDFRPKLHSAILTRAGTDGVLGTDDDVSSSIEPNANNRISFPPIHLEARESAQISYENHVTANATLGPHENAASADCEIAHETVQVIADPVFDKGTVLGKVFWDLDKNGSQGETASGKNEPGVANVRFITPEGLEVRTDQHGRFHIAGIDVPAVYGMNYVIKLDTTSLAEGSLVYSDLRQIVPLRPGGLGRVLWAVRPPPGPSNVDCCGPYVEGEQTSWTRGPKKLDVLLRSIREDNLVSQLATATDSRFRMEFEIAANYGQFAQCAELAIYEGPHSNKLIRNRIVSLEKHRQWINVGLKNPPKQISYQVFAFKHDADSAECQSRFLDVIKDEAEEAHDQVIMKKLNLSDVDATARRTVSLPAAGEVYFPDQHPHSKLAIDNIEVRSFTSHKYTRQYEQDRTNLYKAGEFLLEPNMDWVGPNQQWQANPRHEHWRSEKPLLQNSCPAVTVDDVDPYCNHVALKPRNQQDWLAVPQGGSLETTDYQKTPAQIGGEQGWVHLERHPAFVHDHIDFSAEGRKARSVCCDIETEIETFFDQTNNSYGIKVQNLHHQSIDICLIKTNERQVQATSNQDELLKLIEECRAVSLPTEPQESQILRPWRVGRILEPQQTNEFFLGNFDNRGPQANDDWESLFVFIRPSTSEVLLGELIGYQVERERVEERGHWRPPRINQICGLVNSVPQKTAELKIGSIWLSDDVANPPTPVTPIDPTNNYGVAVIDISAGSYQAGGSLKSLAEESQYDDFIAARVAGYWSGIKQTENNGILEWTLQADSTKDDLDELSRNLKRKDPQRLFRQLDPDNYYPTYGDDSSVINKTDSQSAYFAEVKYGAEGFGEIESRLGNFHTDFTGTEFAHYNRSLFGLNTSYQSDAETTYGDKKFAIKGFASEAQTAVAHAEFEATGGSLYYLRHTDVVMGSEKIWVEVRRRDSRQIEERRILVAGRDYEIDPLQGRVLLRSPLNQVLRDSFNSVIRTEPLNGDDVFLLVDYEYLPDDFDSNQHVYGARAKGWVGANLGLGGTYAVDEQGLGENSLAGVDGMYRFGTESYVSAEYARTKTDQTSSLGASLNGGLTFDRERGEGPQSGSASARSAEVYVDFSDVPAFEPEIDGDVKAWWNERERGYNTHRYHTPNKVNDAGVEFSMSFAGRWSRSQAKEVHPPREPQKDWQISGRAVETEEHGVSKHQVAEIQIGHKFGCNSLGERCWSLDAAVRYEEADRETSTDPWIPIRHQRADDAHYVGVRVAKELEEDLTVYASLQSGDAKENNYADGEHVAVGLNRKINDKLAVGIEQSYGDRGPATMVGVDYSPGPKSSFNVASGVGAGATTQIASRYELIEGHEVFGTYTMSPDRTDGAQNNLSFGQRTDAGRRTRIFSESQFGNEYREVSTGHAFGIEHVPKEEWVLSGLIQASEVQHKDMTYERSAYSLGATYHGEQTRLTSRVELREDESSHFKSRQYVTSNAFEWRINEEHRLLGKLNAALVDDNDGQEDVGRFVELGVGYAHRPIFSDKFNFLSRYTYLSDVGTRGQSDAPGDERSHLAAFEGTFDFGSSEKEISEEDTWRNGYWSLGGKIAVRAGKERSQKGVGSWSESKLGMGAVRATYRVNLKHRSKICPDVIRTRLKTEESLRANGLEPNLPPLKYQNCKERPAPFYNNVELVAEYRVLKDFEGDNSRRGALVGVYKHFDSRHANWKLANTIRVGVGYNFSGFDDRLRHKSYKADGFFVDAMVAF